MTESGDLFHIRVTQIIDPLNFWAHLGTDESFEQFKDFEASIQEAGETGRQNTERKIDIDMLEEGRVVLARSADVAKWLRARVATISREHNEVDAFYIDFGNTEFVTVDNVVEIPLALDVNHLSPQAWRTKQAAIKPIANTWISRAVTRFKELVLDKILDVQAIGMDRPSSAVLVDILVEHNSAVKSVSEILVEEGLAMPEELPETKGQASADTAGATMEQKEVPSFNVKQLKQRQKLKKEPPDNKRQGPDLEAILFMKGISADADTTWEKSDLALAKGEVVTVGTDAIGNIRDQIQQMHDTHTKFREQKESRSSGQTTQNMDDLDPIPSSQSYKCEECLGQLSMGCSHTPLLHEFFSFGDVRGPTVRADIDEKKEKFNSSGRLHEEIPPRRQHANRQVQDSRGNKHFKPQDRRDDGDKKEEKEPFSGACKERSPSHHHQHSSDKIRERIASPDYRKSRKNSPHGSRSRSSERERSSKNMASRPRSGKEKEQRSEPSPSSSRATQDKESSLKKFPVPSPGVPTEKELQQEYAWQASRVSQWIKKVVDKLDADNLREKTVELKSLVFPAQSVLTGLPGPNELHIFLEDTVYRACTNTEFCGTAITLLEQFTDAENFGDFLSSVLWDAWNKYIRTTTASDTKRHQENYSIFMGKLYISSLKWDESGSVNVCFINMAVRCAVFNKGKQHPNPGDIEEVYAKVLYQMLSVAGAHLEANSPAELISICSDIRDKLMSNTSRAAKEHLLAILELRASHWSTQEHTTSLSGGHSSTAANNDITAASDSLIITLSTEEKASQVEPIEIADRAIQVTQEKQITTSRAVQTLPIKIPAQRPKKTEDPSQNADQDPYHKVKAMLLELRLGDLLQKFTNNAMRDSVLDLEWAELSSELKECGLLRGHILEIKNYLNKKGRESQGSSKSDSPHRLMSQDSQTSTGPCPSGQRSTVTDNSPVTYPAFVDEGFTLQSASEESLLYQSYCNEDIYQAKQSDKIIVPTLHHIGASLIESESQNPSGTSSAVNEAQKGKLEVTLVSPDQFRQSSGALKAVTQDESGKTKLQEETVHTQYAVSQNMHTDPPMRNPPTVFYPDGPTFPPPPEPALYPDVYTSPPEITSETVSYPTCPSGWDEPITDIAEPPASTSDSAPHVREEQVPGTSSSSGTFTSGACPDKYGKPLPQVHEHVSGQARKKYSPIGMKAVVSHFLETSEVESGSKAASQNDKSDVKLRSTVNTQPPAGPVETSNQHNSKKQKWVSMPLRAGTPTEASNVIGGLHLQYSSVGLDDSKTYVPYSSKDTPVRSSPDLDENTKKTFGQGRSCTSCGSRNHVIYDCPDRTKNFFMH